MYLSIPELLKCIQEDDIVTRFTPNPISVLHSHKCLELAYLLKGTIMHSVGGMTYIVSEGEFFIVDYDQPHSYLAVSDGDFRLINVMFRPRLIDPVLGNEQRLKDIYNHYLIHASEKAISITPMLTKFSDPTGLIRQCILSIVREVNERELGWKEAVRGLLIYIISQMLREVCAQETPADRLIFAPKMMDYVREHYMESVKITEACAEGNYSTAYLSKHFKEETGITFSEFVKRVRIEASCRLLLNTNKSIVEISELVGYRDSTFFHNTFRQFMNCSPLAYRKTFIGRYPLRGYASEADGAGKAEG